MDQSLYAVEEISTFFSSLQSAYADLQQLDLSSLQLEHANVFFRDWEQTFVLSEEQQLLLAEALASAVKLTAPPWIYGIPYPYAGIEIDEALTLTWSSPDIFTVGFNDGHTIGWSQLRNTALWDSLRTQYGEQFERKGLFNHYEIRIEADGFILEEKNQNRLDVLWRMLLEVPASDELAPDTNGQEVSIIYDKDGQVLFEIFESDWMRSQERWYYQEELYRHMISYTIVP